MFPSLTSLLVHRDNCWPGGKGERETGGKREIGVEKESGVEEGTGSRGNPDSACPMVWNVMTLQVLVTQHPCSPLLRNTLLMLVNYMATFESEEMETVLLENSSDSTRCYAGFGKTKLRNATNISSTICFSPSLLIVFD